MKKAVVSENKTLRPPIVTLMGHVDHGKTSILDQIRASHLVNKESGGITQHTGAYSVVKNGKKIVFIDTPGHEAFTNMRARGGQAADIVVLVVAADDGIMPQTKEAIMHIKSANVLTIVAINKTDIPGINIEKVKKQLSDNGILLEGYGGDTVAVEVSAKTGKGIDELVSMIMLLSEMNSDRLVVTNQNLEILAIECKHDKKRGNEIIGVVKNGSISLKEEVVVKKDTNNVGKVKIKALIDESGKLIQKAQVGDVVRILGFNKLPMVGDIITSKEFAENETEKLEKTEEKEVMPKKDGNVLNLVVRSDTQGTLEAIISSLEKLAFEDVKVNIMFADTGEVKESDILLASTAKGIIVAFKVDIPNSIAKLAEEKKVIVRRYDIIYKLLEEIAGALEGVVEIEEQKIKGRGLVIQVFTLPKSNMKVAGTLVEAGKFKLNKRVAIYRNEDSKPLYVARIRSIRVKTEEKEEVSAGTEAGLLFKPDITDIKLDDRIEIL